MSNALIQNILLFKRLSEYSAEQIHRVICDESSQVIAVLLVRLETRKAKDVLNLFSPDLQKEIAYKMATAQSVPAEFLNEVANIVGSKLRVFDDKQSQTGVSGQAKMAEILKHMGASKSQELLDALGEKDRGLSSRIKGRMFLFDDVARAEPESLKRSLISVDLDTLALSLKGSTEEIIRAVLGALSANRRAMLTDELKHMGPRKKSDVDSARAEVVSILRGLLEQGILRMQGDRSDDEWVE